MHLQLRKMLVQSHDALFGARARYVRYYASEQWHSRRTPMEWLRVRLHFALDKVLDRVPAKVSEPYLTHIPVLLAIAMAIPVRRVLELGCGRFSTLTFLDHDNFPCLERVDSVENDSSWADQVQAMANNDERLRMHVIDGAVADSLSEFNLHSYDVIFIDDALTREERSRTITTIGAANPAQALTVIHDYDMPVYRRAASGFKHHYRFTALYPNTGVAWCERPFSLKPLQETERLVRKARQLGRIPIDSLAAVAFFKEASLRER